MCTLAITSLLFRKSPGPRVWLLLDVGVTDILSLFPTRSRPSRTSLVLRAVPMPGAGVAESAAAAARRAVGGDSGGAESQGGAGSVGSG